MPPRIILDENLFYNASDYHTAAKSVVKRLKDSFKVDAVYVGQQFDAPCPIRKFRRSNPKYIEAAHDVTSYCDKELSISSNIPKDAKSVGAYKHCVSEYLASIDEDKSENDADKLSGCIPPRGSSDTAIRTWAEANDNVLIVSCDGGRELESTKTDRILMGCPPSGHPSADDIVDRLRAACYRL